MNWLKRYELVYLATPYSLYPAGLEQAFIDAAALAANLLKAGVRAYAPIVHSHPLAIHGKIDPLDHSIWLPFDDVLIERSDALLVAKLPSWHLSKGIMHETNRFHAAQKPVFYLTPETMDVSV